MLYCTCAHGIWSNFCHYEHQVVSDFLLSLVQEVLRGPLPMGRDEQHYTQPTLFECWNHPGVSHDHLTFLVRAFTSWRTSICKRFFVCELTSYALSFCWCRSRRNIIQTFMYFHVSYTLLWTIGFPFLLISSLHGHSHLKMQHYFCTSNFWELRNSSCVPASQNAAWLLHFRLLRTE